jgi:hypothetical protein
VGSAGIQIAGINPLLNTIKSVETDSCVVRSEGLGRGGSGSAFVEIKCEVRRVGGIGWVRQEPDRRDPDRRDKSLAQDD